MLGATSNIDHTSFTIAGVSVPTGLAGKFSVSIKCEQDTGTAVWSDTNITDGSLAISATSLVAGCKHQITTTAMCLDGSNNVAATSAANVITQCTSSFMSHRSLC